MEIHTLIRMEGEGYNDELGAAPSLKDLIYSLGKKTEWAIIVHCDKSYDVSQSGWRGNIRKHN